MVAPSHQAFWAMEYPNCSKLMERRRTIFALQNRQHSVLRMDDFPLQKDLLIAFFGLGYGMA
jgi:hypothetical protein